MVTTIQVPTPLNLKFALHSLLLKHGSLILSKMLSHNFGTFEKRFFFLNVTPLYITRYILPKYWSIREFVWLADAEDASSDVVTAAGKRCCNILMICVQHSFAS